MAPTSNPTRRVTAILDLLTLHPEGFTLAEIARRLDLSKSTCLAIVTELAAASYLAQDVATRRYRLGPALVAIAETVSTLLPGIPQVREALRDLSDELGVVCGANILTGDDMVVVVRVGPPDPLDTAPVGQRVPFAPPYGFSFIAWSDRSTFVEWLERSPVPIDDRALDVLEHSLAAARQRGWAVLREQPSIGFRRLAAEQRYLRGQPGFQERFNASVDELLHVGFAYDEIEPGESYRFMSVHAPITASGPRAQLSPHILGTPAVVPGSTIIRYAERLAQVAAELHVPAPPATR
jgi:DNA-binding IclR family transcriptional regulator